MGHVFLDYNSLTSSAAASSGSEDSESDSEHLYLPKLLDKSTRMNQEDLSVRITLTSAQESSPSQKENQRVIDKGTGRECILHEVTKLDTVAGLAIKYGVEVADIKRINRISTDLQLFALKYVRVPLPNSHDHASRPVNTPPASAHTSSGTGSSQGGRRSTSEAVTSTLDTVHLHADPVKEITSSLEHDDHMGGSAAAAGTHRNTFFFSQMREAAEYLSSGADEVVSPHASLGRQASGGPHERESLPSNAVYGRGDRTRTPSGGDSGPAPGGWEEWLGGQMRGEERGGGSDMLRGGRAGAGRAGGRVRRVEDGARRRVRNAEYDEEEGSDGRSYDDFAPRAGSRSQRVASHAYGGPTGSSGNGAGLGQVALWGGKLMDDLVSRLHKTASMSTFEAASSVLFSSRHPAGRAGMGSSSDAGSIDLPVIGFGRSSYAPAEDYPHLHSRPLTPSKPTASSLHSGSIGLDVTPTKGGMTSESDDSPGAGVAVGGSASKGMSLGQLQRRSAGGRRASGKSVID